MVRLLLSSFDGFDKGWARGGATAGLTVWAVLVPESRASRPSPVSRRSSASTQRRSDLERRTVTLALAHGIGQVRDVLDHATSEAEPLLFQSIDEAIAQLRG